MEARGSNDVKLTSQCMPIDRVNSTVSAVLGHSTIMSVYKSTDQRADKKRGLLLIYEAEY